MAIATVIRFPAVEHFYMLVPSRHAGTRPDPGKLRFHRLLGDLLIVVGLEVEPHFGRPRELAFETQCRVDRDRPLPFHDLVDPARRHAEVLGDPVFRNAQRQQEILAEDLARMGGWQCFHSG